MVSEKEQAFEQRIYLCDTLIAHTLESVILRTIKGSDATRREAEAQANSLLLKPLKDVMAKHGGHGPTITVRQFSDAIDEIRQKSHIAQEKTPNFALMLWRLADGMEVAEEATQSVDVPKAQLPKIHKTKAETPIAIDIADVKYDDVRAALHILKGVLQYERHTYQLAGKSLSHIGLETMLRWNDTQRDTHLDDLQDQVFRHMSQTGTGKAVEAIDALRNVLVAHKSDAPVTQIDSTTATGKRPERPKGFQEKE